MQDGSRRILVTGACLQGNKGGPALILALTDLLKRWSASSLEVCVAVAKDLELECPWAERYGFGIVEDLTLRDCVPPWSWRSMRRGRRAVFREALDGVDAVINVAGIAYVGPPSRGWRQSLPTYCSGADVVRRRIPWIRFTQSYGPFSSRAIRFLARREFRRLDKIFVRGERSAREVRELCPDREALVFPDVAVALDPAPPEWAEARLRTRFGAEPGPRLVSISPSATARKHGARAGLGRDVHRACCVAAIEAILRADPASACLVVPHTVRIDAVDDPASSAAATCDLVFAREVVDSVGDVLRSRIFLEDEDLDAREMKALIASSTFHIGARYHSLVAALSSGTPSIALAWHHKYRELFELFGRGGDVIDAADAVDTEVVARRVLEAYERRGETRDDLAPTVNSARAAVEHSGRILCELLLERGVIAGVVDRGDGLEGDLEMNGAERRNHG